MKDQRWKNEYGNMGIKNLAFNFFFIKRITGKVLQGIVALGLLLVLATGSASASGVCVWGDIDAGQFYVCGDTVTKPCTLNDTITCEGDGLIIGSGQIRIYGDGYCIEGDGTGTGIYNPGSSTFFELHDLEIKNFETGIGLRHVTGTTIYNYLIVNSNIHNNAIGIEIEDLNPKECTIENCEFHHNDRGIYVHGENGTHIKITNNRVYDNVVSGIHSEDVCTHCWINCNIVSANGRGIDLNASRWALNHNLVTNNSESGIFVGGSNNLIRYNTVGNNEGGIHIAEGSESITLEVNAFCNNKDRDVFVDSICNVSGDGNACEIAENYNDTGTSGCTYHCTGCIGESGIVYRCGGIVTESCTFDGDIICPEGNGLIVFASGTEEKPLVIDGVEHVIDGITPGDSPRTGIYNPDAHDYLTIKNLEVAHFHCGINLGGSSDSPGIVERNVIDHCKVHDNGDPDAFYTHGIATYHARNCSITYCEIYNNTGFGCGSCDDGGRGLLVYGPGDHNNVTYNRIHGNGMSGIYSKMQSKHNYIAYNDVYENGKYIPEGGTYAPGGIILACKLTDYWIVEHNNITNNTGYGMYVGGSYNIIRHNDIKNSKNAPGGEVGYGINVGRSDGSHDNELYNNIVCENEDIDIQVWSSGAGNTGDENTCDMTYNYDDTGTTGCTYRCSAAPDLVITDKSEEWIDLYNRTYNISYTIKNIGTVSATESTTSISIDGTEVATDAVMGLAMGETSTNTLGPFSMSGIRDTIMICADSKANFTESEEGNNCCDNVFEYPRMPAEVHPPTSFLIWGFVFYDGAPDLNPTVTIKNINTSKEWHAESYANYNYYRVVLASGRDVNESEILRFNATSPEGSQSFNHIITLDAIFNGGLFNFNITPEPEVIFDTGEGTYPSISGTHNGTITPAQNTTVNRMYTYACTGTGGHTEYVRIWNESEKIDGQGNWSGYPGDYHNVTISPAITLLQGHTYNYTIETGSYPQIVHAKSKPVTGGNITCTKFTDANGKEYENGIPAIRLFYEGQ